MKQLKRMICLALVGAVAVLSACASTNALKAVSPSNGSVNVEIANEEINEFLSKPWTQTLCDEYYEDGWCHYEPVYVDFAWSGEADTLVISRYADLSNGDTYACEGSSFSLRGLQASTTYYWQLANGEEKSEIYSFTTQKTVRTVYIGGVTNTRDMGGWTVYDESGNAHGELRQGLLFRSATLDGISPEGIEYFTQQLGIKTELDLRAETETQNRPMIDGVEYINISCPQYAYTGMGIFEFGEGNYPNTTDAVREIIAVFAEEENYPINFHCAIGRDRTGTIAFILGALCGMSEEDLCREYDLSYFAGLDSNSPSRMHRSAFMPLVNRMKNYRDGNRSLAYNTREYLLDIGLSQAQIDGIYNVLVEERK